MMAWVNSGWVQDVVTNTIFLLIGTWLARKHVVRPARQRHAEQMAAHARTHQHLEEAQ